MNLPEWFEALNGDFRYQLTAVVAPGPNLYIASEIRDKRFMIAGGKAGMKVSWQVTGICRDAYARAHQFKVEEEKPVAERGLHFYPKLYGQPEEKGILRAAQERVRGDFARGKAKPVPKQGAEGMKAASGGP